MDRNQENRNEGPKDPNDIRIGMGSRVRNVITYCNALLNDKKARDLKFSAVGGAIGKLVDAVEVLKIMNPGMYQSNKIATVSYQTVDNSGKVFSQRLYPKLEVVLSLDEPKDTKGEGFQNKLGEEQRVALLELLNKRPTREGDERPRGGRGGPRGGFRGGRGFPRGGPREGRGGPRGGFRGGRGFSRGGPRGAPRGAPRGGFRGAPRGGPRGGPSRGRGPSFNRGRGF